MYPQINLDTLPVASQLDWRVEFGLWLRNTPSQKKRKRDQDTLAAYERDVKLMAAWFENQYNVAFEPSHMNEVNLQEYFRQFENAPATHKRKLASIHLLIKWSMLNGVLETDPSGWIAFVDAVEQAPRDLLPEEEQRLRRAAEAMEADGSLLGLRDSLFLHLMLDAGLRISEAVELKLTDLADLEKGKMHVLGKGLKHRHVHVRSTLATRIRLWLDRMPVSVAGTLITSESGLPIERGQAWRRFVAITEIADVKATPHSCRHQFVMNYMAAYMKGDPMRFPAALKAASQETGDNVAVLLKYYTGPRESEMRAAMEVM